MKILVSKINLAFKGLKYRLLLDNSTKRFISFNENRWLKSEYKKIDSVVLVDKFTWNPWIYYYSYITNIIAKNKKSRIKYFYFPLKKNWFEKMLIPDRRLNSVYKSFGCDKGLTSVGNFSFLKQSNSLGRSFFNNLKSKNKLLELEYKGILIGDLIYDTYLRNTAKSTVNLQDIYLLKIIQRAFRITMLCEEYFLKNKVEAIVPSHNVYISYGIIVRLGARFGIPSYRINSRQRGMTQFNLIKIEPPFFLGVHPYYEFKSLFKKLNDNQQIMALKLGKDLLENRLSGNIDPGIVYMKKSSFNSDLSDNVFLKNGKPNVVIFLHCFFDSPHRYRSMLFPDFFEWINFTLNEATQTDFNWYVKPHPNGLPGNNKIVDEIKKDHPKINFINDSVSNLQLIKEGVSSIFTVFGTVGHEFAYKSIPVINAGDNPHVSFNFNFNPKSIEDYKALIHKAGNLELEINKDEVKAYAYLYYLHYDTLNSKYKNVIKDDDFINSNLGINQYSSKIYDYYIQNYSNEKDKRIIEYIESFLDINK